MNTEKLTARQCNSIIAGAEESIQQLKQKFADTDPAEVWKRNTLHQQILVRKEIIEKAKSLLLNLKQKEVAA
jgi:hypothetical protein